MSNTPVPRERIRERLVLLALAAAQFTNLVDFVVVMPLGPRIMRSLEIGPQQFSLIVSSYTFSASFVAMLASLVIDRFDRRKSFLAVVVGFTFGTISCALAGDYASLLVARVVTGAFGGLLGGLALTIIGEVFPDERRGAATGAFMGAFSLASIVGVPLGLLLANHFDDWHAPFAMLSLPSIVSLAAGVWLLPRLDAHLALARPNPLANFAATLARPIHVWAFFLVASIVMGGFMVVPYLGSYLVINVKIDESRLFWVYVAGGGATLLTSPLIGRLADRVGRFTLFAWLAPAGGLMMFAATSLPVVPLWIAMAVIAALMIGNTGRMIVAMTMVNARIDPQHRGSFMSLSSAIQHLASGCGAFAAGQIVGSDAAGSLTNFNVVGAFALAASFVSVALATPLRRPADRPARLRLTTALDRDEYCDAA
jgi:predicted MFS family arabinose efflux permease